MISCYRIKNTPSWQKIRRAVVAAYHASPRTRTEVVGCPHTIASPRRYQQEGGRASRPAGNVCRGDRPPPGCAASAKRGCEAYLDAGRRQHLASDRGLAGVGWRSSASSFLMLTRIWLPPWVSAAVRRRVNPGIHRMPCAVYRVCAKFIPNEGNQKAV